MPSPFTKSGPLGMPADSKKPKSEPRLMFFDSWASVGRVVVMAVTAYAALIFLLRISGKRTLSKMNAFDFVVTIAFGSMLATIIFSPKIPLVDGVVGLACLVFLQYLVTWISVRSAGFQRMMKADPRLLYFKGDYDEAALRRERISREEVLAAMRQQGEGDPSKVQAVVLETEGTLSVLHHLDPHDGGSLATVEQTGEPQPKA